MKRREFICLTGAGLTLGLFVPVRGGAATAASSTPLVQPLVQPFLRIGDDGSITVISKHLEMGQGVHTGLASIVAEELDADWASVRVEAAPADRELYKHLLYGMQSTGGSTSISNSWDQLRRAGATARAMLVAAAATRFALPMSELTVAAGVVSHPSGARATFGELASAAAAVTVPAKVPLKDPKDYRLLGKVLQRVDTPSKTDGSALYAGDIRLPGMKVALLLRAPRFGALVKTIDDRAALARPGVVQVVGIPRGKPHAVAVIAETTWAALQARQVLEVTWDDGAPDGGAEKRSSGELAALFADLSSSGPAVEAFRRGHAESAMQGAHRIVEADYLLPYLAHQAMEPLVSVGFVRDGRSELWAGSQNVTADHAAACKILGLPPEHVCVNTTFAGGSFGRRATFTADWVSELAQVLVATDRRWPIRLTWTREDDVRGGYYRPMAHHRMRAALGADGRMLAVEQTIVAQSFLFPPPAEGQAPARADPLVIDGALPTRYDVGQATLRWVHPRVGVPVQMYRALALNHTTFTKEMFIEEAARAAGRDPFVYRLMHLDPANPGQARQSNVLRLAAERAGWGRPLPPGTALGIAVQEAEGSFVAQAAQVRMAAGVPVVERVTCVIDCGRALNPAVIRAQMESGIAFGLTAVLFSGITLDDGRVRQSNFHDQRVLSMTDMPRAIDIHIVDSTRPPTGVGEPGSVCIVPAVANAVATLLGRPVRTLPLVRHS